MHKRVAGVSMVLCLGGVGAVSTAVAANSWNPNSWTPLGFYVGAGVGYSDVRGDGNYFGDDYGYDRHDTAWKVLAGLRPIAPVGAELEYIDFGNPSLDPAYAYDGYSYDNATTDTRATVLFGVGYLPIPLPFLDVFGKVGVARLEETSSAYYTYNYPVGCGVCAPVPAGSDRQTDWSTDLAYGAGVQAKFANLAVRAEYERISTSGRDPDAVTVSATWTF